MSTLYDVLEKTFAASPSLGWALLLLIWLAGAWWFRLVSIGPKRSFRVELLQRTSIVTSPGNGLTLAQIGARVVTFTPPATDRNGEEWSALEVYSLYCTLRAREWLVKSSSVLYAFMAFSISIMNAAGPTGTVSLPNVVQITGLIAGLGVILAAVLALISLLVSLHTVPDDGRKLSKLALFLFAW